jgi:hypothetical protein
MSNTIVSMLEYFFGFSPPQTFVLQWTVWPVLILSLVAAVLIYLKAKKSRDALLRKTLMEYPGKFLTISALLAVNLLSRLNRVEVLSMRFITFLLVLWLIFSFYGLYRDLAVNYPRKISLQKQKIVSLEEKYKIHKNKPKKQSKRRK